MKKGCLLILLGMTLVCACRPFSGNLVNRTGQNIELRVLGTDKSVIAFGQLKNDTALSLDSKYDELGEISFTMADGGTCRVDKEMLTKSRREEDGIWVVDITAC
jgi:hypothetical protein